MKNTQSRVFHQHMYKRFMAMIDRGAIIAMVFINEIILMKCKEKKEKKSLLSAY